MKKEKANILIGVCGGIAAYKVCQLIRLFVKNDYAVKAVMTEAACQFIRPLLFKELTGNPVYLDMFSDHVQSTQHIKLSKWADLTILAPLSANTLSKIASGICDNLLTTVVCALNPDTPVLLCPSMNEQMWRNSIIQKNLSSLKKIRNYTILPPEKGELACKTVGTGRMPAATKIYKKSLTLLR